MARLTFPFPQGFFGHKALGQTDNGLAVIGCTVSNLWSHLEQMYS